jgi:Transposase DDE domain
MLLCRAKSVRTPEVLRHLPDGSYLSRLDALDVRIIEAEVTMTGADGSHAGDHYRLITTLLDPGHYPAAALARLYHERWEIESAFLALRHTLLDGRILRSGDRPGVEQELWALLTLYQLLRMAMVTAVETRPGTNPDRASFTTALETARDQLTAAAGVCPDGPADLTGAIGRAVLATLLPARRPRYSARKVKCATSRYLSRDDGRPRTVTTITKIHVTICTPPPPGPTRNRRPHRRTQTGPQPPTRRQRITAIITSQPPRPWHGTELAARLNAPPRYLLSQLAEWARAGLFTRTGPGTYILNTPPALASSTTAPDP